MNYVTATRDELYDYGVKIAKEFCVLNGLPLPKFFRYSEVTDPYYSRLLIRLKGGYLQGTLTGYYDKSNVFVNVDVTAYPVKKPGQMRWSFPGYKTDRTAVGVVCHETGHYVDDMLQRLGRINIRHGQQWRNLIKLCRKQVTSYEPVPSEAWAESMRLFILNPDLLAEGIRPRYDFITQIAGLKPLPRGTFKEALCHHPDYVAAAERWIKKRS